MPSASVSKASSEGGRRAGRTGRLGGDIDGLGEQRIHSYEMQLACRLCHRRKIREFHEQCSHPGGALDSNRPPALWQSDAREALDLR